MKHALVKISTDLFGPGARISHRMVQWIGKWDQMTTHRIIYPTVPLTHLMTLDNDKFLVTRDFIHIRFTPIDDVYAGPMDSELDAVLTHVRLDEFLGEELSRIAQTGLIKAPPYQDGITYAGWMELWEFDEKARKGKSIKEISLQEIVGR
jgi:hypothetical protein